MYRKTHNVVDVPADVETRFTRTGGRGEQTWVPQRIEEQLRETDVPIGTHAPYYEYTVTVRGAILKKDGTPGGNSASIVFVDPKPTFTGADKMGLDDIPAELAGLLAGEAALRTWTRP